MSHLDMALNRAAYQAVLDDVSDNLQTVVDAIASCEADIADREARLRVLHLQRDQLAASKERYEAFLAGKGPVLALWQPGSRGGRRPMSGLQDDGR